jgi:hypothetical protein
LEAAQRDERLAQTAEQIILRDIDTAMQELQEAGHHHQEFHFTVDGEEHKACRRELTANQIISEFGKKDPATNYLVEIRGTHKVSYQGKGDQEIKLRECESFQIVSTGPTPVSDCTGPAAFAEGLRALGYEPATLPNSPDHIFFNYPVEVGRFAGRPFGWGSSCRPTFPIFRQEGLTFLPRSSPSTRRTTFRILPAAYTSLRASSRAQVTSGSIGLAPAPIGERANGQ